MAQTIKNCLWYWRPGFNPWVWKMPWRREWQPTPVFLPGEFHGHRSLVGCHPWGCKESDTTEPRTVIMDQPSRGGGITVWRRSRGDVIKSCTLDPRCNPVPCSSVYFSWQCAVTCLLSCLWAFKGFVFSSYLLLLSLVLVPATCPLWWSCLTRSWFPLTHAAASDGWYLLPFLPR